MKASMALSGEVRSRDVQQFLNTYAGDSNKTFFLYCKDKQIFLTTDAAEASASKYSRKELLSNLKNSFSKAAYGNEMQSLLQDIRNLAKPLSADTETNTFEDDNNYLSLTSVQLKCLIKYRNDPDTINSGTSRNQIIEKSIKSMKSSLEKYSTASKNLSDDKSEKIQKNGKILGNNLAKKITQEFHKQKIFSSPTEKQIFSILFFTDDIKKVKETVRNYCISEFGGDLDDSQLEAIAAGIRESLSNIRPGSIQNHTMKGGDTAFLADTLKMNDQIYQLTTPDYVGKGGQGFVHMYRNQSNPKELIAVKSPVNCALPEDLEESNKVSQNELTMHLRAMGTGHENVVEVKGAFIVQSKICIALEDCSFGTLDGFVTRKLDSIEDIEENEMGLALLTIGKDILRGLDFLHTESKIMHGDVKPQNVFMGVDGKAKIGDFDFSAIGKNIKREEQFLPDTPQYTSPSLIDQKIQYKAKFAAINAKYDHHVKKIRSEKYELEQKKKLGGDHKAIDKSIQELNIKTSALEKERRAEHKKIDKSLIFSQGDDVYAAGVTLYELFFGSNPFDRSDVPGSMSDCAEAYGKLTAEARSDFLFKNKNLSLGLQQHTDDIKKLISGLMDPDPAKRLSTGDALKNPVFADSTIGSDTVRKIIVKVGQTVSS